jgi:hypothetical protein
MSFTRAPWRRKALAGLLTGLPVVTLAIVFTMPLPSPAEAQGFNPFGWMQQMFTPGRPGYHHPRQSWHPRSDTLSGPNGQNPVAQKPAVPPSFFVAVLGDSLGQQLAQGLTDDEADQPAIAILNKGRENSGLVRDDFYDWTAAAKALLASGQKINVAVMLIGSNDHQAIHDNGATYDPGTPEWNDIYARRVETIAAMFRDAKVPLLWVGLPIMKSDRYASAMASLNDLDREHAANAGATFVDVWDQFGDDQGHFSTYGPDVNGQVVRLRSSDGVHFTRAGARKLAQFVDTEIKQIFDASKPNDNAALAKIETTNPAGTTNNAKIIVPEKPAIGPILPLTGPVLAPGGQLQTVAPGQKEATKSLVERTFINGDALPPQPGRADDFSWPPK